MYSDGFQCISMEFDRLHQIEMNFERLRLKLPEFGGVNVTLTSPSISVISFIFTSFTAILYKLARGSRMDRSAAAVA